MKPLFFGVALVTNAMLCVGWTTTFAQGIAVVGGAVYTMESDEPLRGVTVLVEDGRVLAVGADLEVPFDYEHIDATGKVVTPGLIESHSQLGLQEMGLEPSTVDGALAAYPRGPSFDVSYAVNSRSVLFGITRAEGVTRAIVAPLPTADPLAGWGAAVRLTDSEAVTASRVAMFGSFRVAATAHTGGSRGAVVQRVSEALRFARRFTASRYEPGPLDYPVQDMLALKALLAGDQPLVLAIDRATEIAAAIDMAQEFRLRLVVLGGAEAWQLADELAAARVPVVVDTLANLPVSFDALGARLDNAALLHRAGVTLLFTSQLTQNAWWLRQVGGNAVAHGLPWPAALAAMTRNPAQVWGMPEGAGTLVVGGAADLVVWSGDPLDVGTWAERVMIDGVWQSNQTRQTRLLDRYRDISTDEPPFGYR